MKTEQERSEVSKRGQHAHLSEITEKSIGTGDIAVSRRPRDIIRSFVSSTYCEKYPQTEEEVPFRCTKSICHFDHNHTSDNTLATPPFQFRAFLSFKVSDGTRREKTKAPRAPPSRAKRKMFSFPRSFFFFSFSFLLLFVEYFRCTI